MVSVGADSFAVGAVRLPERFHEVEDPVAHGVEHVLRGEVLKARPAQAALLGGKDRLLDGFAETVSLALLEGVQLVESLDEEQVSELLDDSEGVGDATGPHSVPDLIHFGFQFASNHIKKCV